MRAAKCVADRLAALAFRAEPAAVRPDHPATVGAVLEVGRDRWPGHRRAIGVRGNSLNRPMSGIDQSGHEATGASRAFAIFRASTVLARQQAGGVVLPGSRTAANFGDG